MARIPLNLRDTRRRPHTHDFSAFHAGFSHSTRGQRFSPLCVLIIKKFVFAPAFSLRSVGRVFRRFPLSTFHLAFQPFAFRYSVLNKNKVLVAS